MQKELTNAGPLLNERGELCEAGYARRLIKAYDRRAIKAAAHRIRPIYLRVSVVQQRDAEPGKRQEGRDQGQQ